MYADFPFLISENQKISYKKFGLLVENCAKNLEKLGLKVGERITIYAPNCPEVVVLFFTLWQLGLVVVPLNIRWPIPLLINAMKMVRSKKLIVAREYAESIKNKNISFYKMEDLVNTESYDNRTNELERIEIFNQQDASVIFSSGSSGAAKAILLSMENHIYSAVGANRNISFKQGDRWLICLPFFHIGGLAILFRAIVGGGALIIPRKDMNLERQVKDNKFTHISLVNTQLFRLLNIENIIPILSNVKAIILGGSSFSPSIIEQASQFNLPLYLSYGCTEMSSQISTTSNEHDKEKLFTCGKPLEFSEIRIAEDGEILVRGKTLFRGYIEEGSLNTARTGAGWYQTGDLGYLDKDGYLVVTGRKDNMFISGGENIQPEVIERILKEITGVDDAIVVPVESEEFGKRPVAFIKGQKKNQLSLKKINIYLEKKLPRYAIPDFYFDFPSGQYTNQLKINRQYLSTIAAEMLKIG